MPTGDFQDLPQWREPVVATAASLHRHGRAPIVAPMSVLRVAYADEIAGGLRAHGIHVLQVLLDAPDDELRRRIENDAAGEHARAWRLAHLAAHSEARPWLTRMADITIDTRARSPADAARAILEATLGRTSAERPPPEAG